MIESLTADFSLFGWCDGYGMIGKRGGGLGMWGRGNNGSSP